MWGTITGLYIVCLALGFIYTLIGTIFGELSSHGDIAVGGDHGFEAGGHDADIAGDHGMEVGHHADIPGLHVSPLNSLTIATFVGSFGAMGLIGQWGLKLDPWPSLAFAIPTAFVAAAVQFAFYVKILIGSTASSEATVADILNCTGEVITPIPDTGVGEVAYVIKGFRYSAPARSVDGVEILRGSRVRVVRTAAGVLYVREF